MPRILFVCVSVPEQLTSTRRIASLVQVNVENGSLLTAPLNAMRSFEVFLGRRFDPAESELLTSDGGKDDGCRAYLRDASGT
jgi:hypothetical protein